MTTNTIEPSSSFGGFNHSTPGLQYTNKDESLVLNHDAEPPNKSSAKLGFNLCLPSFLSFEFNITATSQASLEESKNTFDSIRGQVRFDKIRKQLLYPPR